jgi:oligo-alginate lyase
MTRTIWLMCLAVFAAPCSYAAETKPKQASVFYPARLIDNARQNIDRYDWAKQVRDGVVEQAEPWMGLSDQKLWDLIFGPTITRSWMVWSNGHCPSCKESVPMYNWEMEAMERPWKTRCPHCQEVFPKNDFHKFYRSGLDPHGVFDPARADRSLLFNPEYPDPDDPLHKYGVDDGEGYIDGDKRWRFIGAYLVYGQWKQAVLGGIKRLSAAYVVTGDKRYAHKAAVMLDRVADLYPTFDFRRQALLYESVRGNGYVSVWHDACEETRELALAYDQVFEGIENDQELVAFLRAKAEQFAPANPKNSIQDIRANIEARILRDALANTSKISSNYPRTPIAIATMKAILGWPDNREEVLGVIDGFLERATATDGVTGEKGLANYSAFGLQSVALFLGEWDRAIPGFLDEAYRRQPRLHDMYRFHIDTWCLTSYYPLSGDTGWFAREIDQYQGVRFVRPDEESGYSHTDVTLSPSMFTFMWRLHQLTGDPAFVQALYIANNNAADGLPYDLFADDPQSVRDGVARVIATEGGRPKPGSVNKQQWHIAVLRSGEGPDSRAAWLDYDSGGGHGHTDGMNLGLFAKGLDLMPDFGYPPVQFGGWGSPKARWYRMTASHNTVVVDGKNQANAAGKTTLWADGERFHCIRASAPAMIGGQQYERTVATVDISGRDFYLVDIFRVVGGKDHAKFMQSHFGSVSTKGLSLGDAEPYGHGTQMRGLQTDPHPDPGWHVEWEIEDRYEILSEGTKVRLRYTDLTTDARASTAEGWVTAGQYNTSVEAWIPRIIVRRGSEKAPLASTFVSVIEPFGDESKITSIRRLPLHDADGVPYSDANVAVEIEFRDGSRDLLIAADVENPLGLEPAGAGQDAVLVQPDWKTKLAGELCVVRKDKTGKIERIALCRANSLAVADTRVDLKGVQEFIELTFDEQGRRVVTGSPDRVRAPGTGR